MIKKLTKVIDVNAMNIFVTGGTHCLGRAVIRLLVFQGHRVFRLNEHITLRNNIPRSGIREVYGSLQKEETWQKELMQCDAVIHLANTPHVDERHWRSRRAGTQQLIKAMAQNKGPKRIIFLSTLSNERQEGIPAQRVDQQIEEEIRASGLRYTIFRSSWITGMNSGQKPFARLKHAWRRTWRDISHTATVQPIALENVVEGIVKAVRRSAVAQVYNIAGPQVLTISEIRRIIQNKKRHERIASLPIRNYFMFPSSWQAYHISPSWIVDAWCNPVPYFRDFHIRPIRFAEAADKQTPNVQPKHTHHSLQ